MTWFTTHLALEGLIGFLIIGSTLRSKFLESNRNKVLFLLANVMAIVPDFDVYLGNFIGTPIHRGFTHSLFFPLIFIILGYVVLIYLKLIRKNNISTDNESKTDIKSLLPYFLFLSAFFWGFHILLDMDSGEGGMMLLWPLDDRLYQVSLVFLFNAIPLLFLPWTPIGIEFDVDQTTIKGLFTYLLNWTPQDFQNYYGTTRFNLVFDALILHISVLILYIHYVIRPLIPKNVKLFSKFSKKKFIFKNKFNLRNYWKRVPKVFLGPGIMILIIGFSIGPLISEKVYDNQQRSGTIEFNKRIFKPFFRINIETVNQPLDPNSLLTINYSYSIQTSNPKFTIINIITTSDWFNGLSTDIKNIADQYMNNNTPMNDSKFKQDYQDYIEDKFEINSPINKISVNESEKKVNNIYSTNLKNVFSIGFILKDWNSSQSWNETNIYFSIHINLETSYERNTNYLIGIFTQIIGISFVLIALYPFKSFLRQLE